MSDTFYISFSITVVVFSFLYLWLDFLAIINPKAVESYPTSYDNATKALDRIEKWATWLTGLQTAAMGIMALLYKEYRNVHWIKELGFFAVLFMGVSIILTTWTLSSLASIQQRLLKETSLRNDIYNARIFSFITLRLGPFTGLSHLYSLIGLIFWCLYIFIAISSSEG